MSFFRRRRFAATSVSSVGPAGSAQHEYHSSPTAIKLTTTMHKTLLCALLGIANSTGAFVVTNPTNAAPVRQESTPAEFLAPQRVGTALRYKGSDMSAADEEDWDQESIEALSARRPAVDLPPDAPSDADVEAITKRWITRAVIGLNLCPFAERPLRTKELSFHTIRGDNPEHIIEAVTEQLLLKKDEKGTSLVICPEFPDDFEEYMALVQFIETRVMVYFDLVGHVQIAPFHPNFTFDSADENIDVFTNRSPYPMFHVLRESEVGAAVTKLCGDPGKVWRRNKRLLEIMEEKLGRSRVVQFLLGRGKSEDDATDDDNAAVNQALRQTKEEMDLEDTDGQRKEVIRGGWLR